jgi:hypothetical protein
MSNAPEADAACLESGSWVGRELADALDDARAETAIAGDWARIPAEITGNAEALEAMAVGRLPLPKSAFIIAASDAKLGEAGLPNGTLLDLLESVAGGESAGTEQRVYRKRAKEVSA